MNIQRDINPENDKKLDKMLDAKFGKRRRSIVKGSTIRTAQSLIKRAACARKQFEDTSFNKPAGEKVSKHNSFAYKAEVTKHGQHDQSDHAPSSRGSKKPNSKKPTRSRGSDSMRGPGDAIPIPETAAYNKRVREALRQAKAGKISDKDAKKEIRQAEAEYNPHRERYLKERQKKVTKGVSSSAAKIKQAEEFFANITPGKKLSPKEQKALTETIDGLDEVVHESLDANLAGRLQRVVKQCDKIAKAATVAKHGKHDQRTHSPTGRAAIAAEKKPAKKPASSKAPSKVRVRAAAQQAKERVTGAVRGAKERVEQTRAAVSRNKEKFQAVQRDIDGVLDGLDSASRLYQELKQAQNLLINRLDDKKKVTKKALTIDEARERHARLREEKVTKAIEKGIGHSLETLTRALKLISAQEPDKKISEADEKKLQEVIDEILSIAGYLEDVKEQGFFEKGDANVPDSQSTFRPSFTTPAVAEEQRRDRTKPNAKGRGASIAREPGY